MTSSIDTYRLLDSGNGRKLEQAGPVLVDRQATTASWRPRLPAEAWKKVDALHVRSERGGGHWEARRPLPEQWQVHLGGLALVVRPTPFGHLGFFAEHAAQWTWMREQLAGAESPRVLNLFAYTGAASVACAQAGAQVTHVDVAAPIVEWARENARANALAPDRIRWIVEDAAAFVRREARRGARYDAVVLDPPTFGRGQGKQVWKIEESLLDLLDGVRGLLAERARFALLSCHTPGYTGIALQNLLREIRAERGGELQSGEMHVRQDDGTLLPSGFFARWSGARP